jgi:hypothetical protein
LDLVVGPSNDIHCTDERRRIVTDGIACSSIQYSAALTAVTAAEKHDSDVVDIRGTQESGFAIDRARRTQARLMSVAHLAIKFQAIANRQRRAQFDAKGDA